MGTRVSKFRETVKQARRSGGEDDMRDLLLVQQTIVSTEREQPEAS